MLGQYMLEVLLVLGSHELWWGALQKPGVSLHLAGGVRVFPHHPGLPAAQALALGLGIRNKGTTLADWHCVRLGLS